MSQHIGARRGKTQRIVAAATGVQPFGGGNVGNSSCGRQ
jgi:hypothetical protein